MSQCWKLKSNSRLRPILDTTQLQLLVIPRFDKNKKHNTRQIYWIMMYALESFMSQKDFIDEAANEEWLANIKDEVMGFTNRTSIEMLDHLETRKGALD